MAQNICDTIPFINCGLNKIIPAANDKNLDNLIYKLVGKEAVQIVHIGDSHLQAAFISEKIKQNLFQYYSTDTLASPGFIFPYTIANTNNPFFYKVEYTGNWEVCKNIDNEKNCKLGLSGITISTKDSVASLNIKMQNEKYNKPVKYYFDKITILHNPDFKGKLKVNNSEATSNNGASYFLLNDLSDSVNIEICTTDSTFELYGIILENSASKINYHTIGVNGATAQSYLKCDFFSDHLKLINPDLVIISLGTNEAYDDELSTLEHEYILKDLIYQLHDASPQAAILLTTANDHYKNREYNNQKVIEINNNIIKISKNLNLSLWDFYNIMGGENSINQWHNIGLTGEDKVHFKRAGYEIQGELFSKALIELIEMNK